MGFYRKLFQNSSMIINSSVKHQQRNPNHPFFSSLYTSSSSFTHHHYSTTTTTPTTNTNQPPNNKNKCCPGVLPATKPTEKPRIVVLGSGWAGCRLLKGVDTDIYDVVCVSPRNHMVFTPLLASTCVGTLEFRTVAEPIGRIQPAISKAPGSYFFLANCTALDTDNHMVTCKSVTDGSKTVEPWEFKISYDKLVIALGAEASTFGIQGVKENAIFLREVTCKSVTDGSKTVEPWEFKISYDKLVIALGAEASTFGIQGVKENAIFLREVHHAQEIRRKLLLNLMLSDMPGISEEEKRRLLHCVVVGGGPTGVEFSGELSDFIIKDVHQRYAHVKDYIHVTLIEANEILSSFDDRLRKYASTQLTKSGVRLVRGIVKDVQPEKILLNDGTEVPYGLLVWSTGVGPSPFINSLPLPKSPGGRVGVDEWLRVPSVEDVYSIGDCSGFLESTGKPTLPALAQVAERQGKYLAYLLNKVGKDGGGRANSTKDMALGNPFVYKHMGSMATIGRYKALVDLRQSKEGKGLSMAGFVSWFVWRSAYLTRVISWRNRFYVAINWLTTLLFGRDISRI